MPDLILFELLIFKISRKILKNSQNVNSCQTKICFLLIPKMSSENEIWSDIFDKNFFNPS